MRVSPSLCNYSALFFCLFMFISVRPYALTRISEQTALIYALQSNSEIQEIVLLQAIDSCNTEIEKLSWIPSGSITVMPSLKQDRSDVVASTQGIDIINPHKTSTIYASTLSAQAQVPLTSGAIIKTGVENTLSQTHAHDTTSNQLSLDMSVSQPLLRNRGALNPLTYKIVLKALETKAARLTNKKKVASLLSEIRTVYFTAIEKTSERAIAYEKYSSTKKRVQASRLLFSLGKASALDTLSTYLDMLDAQALCMDVDNQMYGELIDLNRALGYDDTMVTVDTIATSVFVDSLPQPHEMMRLIEQWDPQLKIFEVISQKLKVQYLDQRNQQLPILDLTFGVNSSVNITKSKKQSLILSQVDPIVRLFLTYEFPRRKYTYESTITALEKRTHEVNQVSYRQDLIKKLKTVYATWNQQTKAIELGIVTKSVARQKLAAAEAGYELGSVELLTVENADRELHQASIAVLQKQIALKKIEIIFDELSGAIFKKFNVSFE